MKISKTPQYNINSKGTIQRKSFSNKFLNSGDLFEKKITTSTKESSQFFAEILKTEVPAYKTLDDFKKPILGFIGKSQAEQALAFKSSGEIQQQTLNCIQLAANYIIQQTEAGNVAKTENSMGSAYCEFNNGITVEAYEDPRLSNYALKYSPLKTLTLGLKGSYEKIVLQAYDNACNAAIFKIFDLIEKIRP